MLKKLKDVVVRKIEPDGAWYFDPEGDLQLSEIEPLFNLTAAEVGQFATASCDCQLWVYRALAYRLGIPVPKADWAWYNL